MSPTTVVPFAGRMFLVASVMALVACGGGDAAGPEPPNPPGVADTIIFDLQTTDVEVGDTARLGFVARDATGAIVPDVSLTWRSLNPTVATVSADGLVTTHGIGEAEIEVEAVIPGVSPALLVDSSQVGSTSLRRVRSKARIVVTPRVSLSPRSANARVHDQTLFTVTVTDQNGQPLSSRPVIKWATSSPSVATIDVTGLTTALSKGTTNVIATVSAGSSLGMTRTATLTVNDECGGIAAVQTLKGTLIYDYAIGGTSLVDPGLVIGSEFHGSVNATMTNIGWEPGQPSVMWTGPLEGNASQVETADGGPGNRHRLEGASPPRNDPSHGALSVMNVIVDLQTCTYKINAPVAIDLTASFNGVRGQTVPSPSVQVFVGAGKTLSVGSGQANPFPIAENDFPGHTIVFALSNQTKDAFVVYNWASKLMKGSSTEPGMGNADVSFAIAVIK